MPNFDTPSGQEKSSSHPSATDAGSPRRLMVTIETIRDLSTFNGFAHPVMVALTPDELRLIAAAPDLADFARNVGGFDDSLLVSADLNMIRATLREWRDEARAALARAGAQS